MHSYAILENFYLHSRIPWSTEAHFLWMTKCSPLIVKYILLFYMGNCGLKCYQFCFYILWSREVKHHSWKFYDPLREKKGHWCTKIFLAICKLLVKLVSLQVKHMFQGWLHGYEAKSLQICDAAYCTVQKSGNFHANKQITICN